MSVPDSETDISLGALPEVLDWFLSRRAAGYDGCPIENALYTCIAIKYALLVRTSIQSSFFSMGSNMLPLFNTTDISHTGVLQFL